MIFLEHISPTPIDTFQTPTLQNSADSAQPQPYVFSEKGIAWPGEAKKYVKTPIGGSGYQNASEIVPPPNWALRFPNNYTEDNIPDLNADEHFQNWMRTAGLPTFTKLYGRNDNDDMQPGIYRVVIGLSVSDIPIFRFFVLTQIKDFPVLPYKGTKSFVISTASWIGGKNPFLGWAYVASACLFILLAILGTARHLIKPRYATLQFGY